MKLEQILKDSNYSLNLFTAQEQKDLDDRITSREVRDKETFFVTCLKRDKEIQVKPEEIVRQLWLKKLMTEYRYPKEQIKVEYPVQFGSGVSTKSADIVVMHTDGEHPYLIFEVKKPKRDDGLKQLKSYCNAETSPLAVWSNGVELIILHRETSTSDKSKVYTQITSIPASGQSLDDVLNEQWTIDKLKEENKLVRERLSLQKVILELEDLVLANATGIDDAFDEVFKLIYAKLYDEWAATNLPQRKRRIQFRRYNEKPPELYTKINNLFNDAKKKWHGIFGLDDKIKLKPTHLLTCVTFLQDIKLFNANLNVIDDAFEYLITDVAKGKKGQYFTPRWVIDMCVKMLNPKITERVIDTAAGSSGFTVHSIFYVAGEKFTAEGLPPAITEYAGTMVYAIDSSPKAVKIAKALNLIAGDGRTNVFELNSLDPPESDWTNEGKAAFQPLLTRFPDDYEKDELNQRKFQYFDFDVLMTNPPFAGNINEPPTLRQYKLAEKNGQVVSKMGRDILFIERNLNFLREGGRMAIVLPQGRLNNTNDLFIRNFIFDRARLLAVVGLHGNTFKPHTGTKTSVLFLQKYTNEELANINEIRNRHAVAWDEHLEELKDLAGGKTALSIYSLRGYNDSMVDEEDLPPMLAAFLQAEFDEAEAEETADETDEDTNDADATEEEDSDEDLRDQIKEMSERLSRMEGRVKGKAELKKAVAETKCRLAARSVGGQLAWLLTNGKELERYRESWLSNAAAEELDYPIFFAVSERGGKDNSGQPVLLRDEETGERRLDHHGHLIVDHDLNVIADEFIEFAKAEGFDFWEEIY